ncbi:MAG: ABC transporter ATP-binding protein [Clostridiaceae bacterium]
MNLRTENICVNIDKKSIVNNFSVDINGKEFVGIVGPNGCGKSTFLKTIYRNISPSNGAIFLNEKDIKKMSIKDTAKQMAALPQESPISFDFKVEEVVMMGRAPHKTFFQTDSKEDIEIVINSLKKVGMDETWDKSFFKLSGGEKQRVLIARALAQNAEFLILDEPTNHLDIKYQLQIMDIIKSLNLTVFAALHDLNIAAKYCDKIYVIKEGNVFCYGVPEEVLKPEVLKEVFGVEAEVAIHPRTGKINIVYL